MKKFKIIIVFVALFIVAAYLGVKFFWKIPATVPFALSGKIWPTQSIDTVKFSRDLAREKTTDKTYDTEIEKQVKNIAATGATHIAIATPYDEEFVPYLTRWVNMARKYNLSVWFRGNLSGWEGWFNYPTISRDDHTKGIVNFVSKHGNLFADGDIFTSCPECENGGPGDPRITGDVDGFRSFLINENNQVKSAFAKMHKNVVSGYYSMNGDVAKLIMDPVTTAALGGVATIDHYVDTPDELISFIDTLASSSGGKVVLGEWGAPIPDINGDMTDKEQLDWISSALNKLSQDKNVVGLNYWTNKGSSTALWNDQNLAKPAVAALTSFYTPREIKGTVNNEVGNSIYGATIVAVRSGIQTDYSGRFKLEILPNDKTITVSAAGYYPKQITITDSDSYDVTLVKQNENILFKAVKWLHQKI